MGTYLIFSECRETVFAAMRVLRRKKAAQPFWLCRFMRLHSIFFGVLRIL